MLHNTLYGITCQNVNIIGSISVITLIVYLLEIMFTLIFVYIYLRSLRALFYPFHLIIQLVLHL